ncbi:ribose 5-phosphate isomerase A, partial [Buchnera aphidicola]|nr:ribose 5-phosphate isomerase A [Buchnera aphidicola]
KNVLGIGTGSTIFYFIEALNQIKNIISGVVSSSKNSTLLLKKHGIQVLELKKFYEIDIYVDSADEINNQMQMIKGRGAALTREKIIASMAKKFICVIDQSKYVNVLGTSPLPIEIIPSSCSYVLHEVIQ